jgi:ribosomal protein S18 acetylase RimI-like enzyme
VLDDGDGRVVGYCIGTEDTASFAQRWRDVFAPSVDPELIPPPDVQTGNVLMEKDNIKHFRKAVHEAECSMLQPWPQMLQKYSAHMHIDILPEYQRKGWGTVLIDRLFEAVKSLGAKGIHLDMLQSNTNGRAFYERIGFQVCPQVLDGGKSGDTGVNGVVITLVKEL